jgi:hypothetical protein
MECEEFTLADRQPHAVIEQDWDAKLIRMMQTGSIP